MEIDFIRLFHGATDDEESSLLSDFEDARTEPSSPLFLSEHDYHPSVRMSALYATERHPSNQLCSFSHRLFDESPEHEPPPPSPIPVAGPLRLLLRPLPTPEQSPVHVVHDFLPSRCASGYATPMTAYPSASAPTPITNEPIIMVYPLRNTQVSALSPVSEVVSPLVSRNLYLEEDRGYMRSNDCVISASNTEWPETRTTINTPEASSQSSPLMVSLPIEPPVASIGESNGGAINDSIL